MVVKFKSTADTGSNKPGSYVVQLTAQAYSYTRPTKFQVAVMRPKVDRIAVTYPVASQEDRTAIRDHLKGLSVDPGAMHVHKWPKIRRWGSVKYARSYGVDVGQGERVLVQCTAENVDVAFLRMEFNPARIGPDGVAQFWSTLAEVTGGKVKHEDVAACGKVTRLDVAVDLINIDLEDLLVATPKPGVSMGYFGLMGKAESKYLNVHKKGSNLYVYDRRERLRKLQEAGMGDGPEYGDAKHTRVEVRTRADKPITSLGGLQNRLKRIDLVDIEAAQPPEEQHHWRLFQDSCRYRGLAGALAQLPVDVRKQYKATVDAVSGELWQPERLWSLWPETIQKSGLLP